jgi:hypothetical protein
MLNVILTARSNTSGNKKQHKRDWISEEYPEENFSIDHSMKVKFVFLKNTLPWFPVQNKEKSATYLADR